MLIKRKNIKSMKTEKDENAIKGEKGSTEKIINVYDELVKNND